METNKNSNDELLPNVPVLNLLINTLYAFYYPEENKIKDSVMYAAFQHFMKDDTLTNFEHYDIGIYNGLLSKKLGKALSKVILISTKTAKDTFFEWLKEKCNIIEEFEIIPPVGALEKSKNFYLQYGQLSNELKEGLLDIARKHIKNYNESNAIPEVGKPNLNDKEKNNTLFELENLDNLFWEEIPVNMAVTHFKIMTEKNSKNCKPFLTVTQFNNFIQRAFLDKSVIPMQTINLASGEKGFVIKRFYEFFSTVAVGQYSAKQKKDKFIKLLSDNFTNWNYETIQPFFKPNKAKKNW